MNDAGIGRVLVASLHQGISDVLPSRVEFYENWFNPVGLRDGRIGLAPIAAVLSFLRREGDAYAEVTKRAGEYAADWTFASLPGIRRALLQAMPVAVRRRFALGIVRQLVRQTYGGSRALVRRGRGLAALEVRGSIFCGVREPIGHPLCGFYAAATERFLTLCGLPCHTRVERCRGAGDDGCRIEVSWNGGPAAPHPTSLAVLLLLLFLGTASRAPAATDRMLVMPFDTPAREPKTFWLSEASSILIVDRLNAVGSNAISREERLRAFAELQVPPAASLSQATIIRVAQLVGARDVVLGTLAVHGDALEIHARLLRLDTGRLETEFVERGALADLFSIFARVATRLTPASATGSSPQAVNPPLTAFEQYVKGLLAETPATQIGFLTGALKIAPHYEQARLALWNAYADQGDDANALAAVVTVPAGSPYYRRARFAAAMSLMNLQRFDEAFSALKTLPGADSTASVLNNLGVVQLRRGSTPQTGRATFYFNQAMRHDPGDADYYFNLGYAYALDHDSQAAIYWLREAVRRNPADADAHFVLSASLRASGAATEAARESELAEKLSSSYADGSVRRSTADPVPRGLERVRHEMDDGAGDRIATTIEATEQREQQELVTFYLERGRRLFEDENDRDSTVELRRAIFLSPYEAEAHLLLGRIYLRTGRVREAVEEFKIALWSQESADAHVALGEALLSAKNEAEARIEAERALKLDPASAPARRLLDRLTPPTR